MLLKTLVFYAFVNYIAAAEVGDVCYPYDDNSPGECVNINNCKEAISEINQYDYHTLPRCGFDKLEEVVCCPKNPVTLNKFGDTIRAAERQCNEIKEKTSPPLGKYIIGGEEAKEGEFPSMVAIGYEVQGDYTFECGGSLVSPRHVLTAAHCVRRRDRIEPRIVRAGTIDIGTNKLNPATDYKIMDITTHPNYVRATKYHDLAILRLEKDAPYTDTLAPICLYTKPVLPTILLTVTGWGNTNTTVAKKSRYLLKGSLALVSREECSKSYKEWLKLPRGLEEGQICAVDSKKVMDACQGDSGGPLQGLTNGDGYYRLVGVTSFGEHCASGTPGVFVDVSRYLDWIESVVWPN